MKKVFIATSSFSQYDNTPIDLLREAGLTVRVNPYGRKLTEDELIRHLSDIEYIIAGTEPLTRSVLETAKRLKVISRCGSGLDNVDINAANRLGIKIFNTPDVVTLAVAELTLGLMLCLLRKIPQLDREFHRGIWQKRMGNLLSGKEVGIVGMGRIGEKVVELLKPFKCEIAYTDPFVEKEIVGLNRLSLKRLLNWADIISLHVSTSDEILGEKELKIMKKGSWLINTSRGKVVNESALYKLLKNNHLSGAALDVFDNEPYNGPLKELDNVIITPHIGSYAKEARIRMEIEAVQNLLIALSESKRK